MRLRLAVACCLAFVLPGDVVATRARSSANPAVPEIHALRAGGVMLDGKLEEEAWRRAPAADGFVQRDPDEGKPATERSELRVLYDDHSVYFGARLYDTDVARLGRQLSRRDSAPDADHVDIYLDPHHDHFTGFWFQVSAAGAQADGVVYNDVAIDAAWDGVWEAAVSVDEDGWTVEMRIPLSQLRFRSAATQTWGINASRFLRRRNEVSWLVMTPRNENGLASRMAHLAGLDGIPASRQLQLLPYVAGRAEFITPSSPPGPFNDGSRTFQGMGLDAKWSVSNSLTLDATVNPDFGQVEVDPAVVNLTAFETLYDERRPFFLEGAQIFNNFGQTGPNFRINFNVVPPRLFYPRRIGRAPQGTASATFVDQPRATSILGAAKLSGRMRNGWRIGVLDAATATESARVANGTSMWRQVVEPASNYLVARMTRDVSRGGYGALFTGVERGEGTAALRRLLPRNAYVIGLDGYYFLDRQRSWVVAGGLSGSRVAGDSASIARLQRSAQRYYQRPDIGRTRFDPAATSLSGWSGRVDVNRNSGRWAVNAALYGISPGFEPNDLGYLTQSDVVGAHGLLMWFKRQPDRITRDRSIWIGKSWTWNFGRQTVADWWYVRGQATFLNYWSVTGSLLAARRAYDDKIARGGPSVRSPAAETLQLAVNTDARKRVSLQLQGSSTADASGGFSASTGVTAVVKPAPSVTFSSGPSVSWSHDLPQYVATVADPTATATLGARYVFADLQRPQVSVTTRLNAVFTQRLSVQVYAQPLLSVGRYRGFKQLAAARTYDFLRYGEDGSSIGFSPKARTYTVDPDGAGPARPFTLRDPSFNFKSLRINAVMRWEWRPGSTLYVAWTQQRQDLSRPGQFSFGPDVRSLLNAAPDDVLLVKVSYWLGR